MLAARVLSDYFTQVTILERGRYPVGPIFRKETPQARHRHDISDEGYRVFERLFPGLDKVLEAAGCPCVTDMKLDTDHKVDYIVSQRIDSLNAAEGGLKKRVVSRPRLEWEIKQQVSKLKNVQIAQECQVQGLLSSANKQQIEGVAARIRSGSDGESQHFQADLVVEASGRHSKIIHWLKAGGFQLPPESLLASTLMMVGCQYERPHNYLPDWITLFIQSRLPYNFREAFLTLIEDKYLLLTVSGIQGFYPPTKNDELLHYLKQLRKPGIYDVVKNLKPLGQAYSYGHTQNRRRHFEQLTDFPDKLIVMGDAACSFNPAYGFGMGLAGQVAEALQQLLKQYQSAGSLVGIGHQFHRVQAETIEATWQKAISMDKRYLDKIASFSAVQVPHQPPREQEPHITAWCNYAHHAQQTGAFSTLKQRLVQLQFPIQAGIENTKAYRDATRRGLPVDLSAAEGLVLEEPAKVRVDVYKGVMGYTPILQTRNRADFEKLVQALAKRNEPTFIPRSASLYFIAGFTNWDRIRTYQRQWMNEKAFTQLDEAALVREWEAEFKKLAVRKNLYQDCFMVSENWMPKIPAGEVGLSEESWRKVSDVIHNEYTAVHYYLARTRFSQRNLPVHNELIAYYVGLVRGIGEFRKDWVLRLWNPYFFEEAEAESSTSRLNNEHLLARAVEHVALFDQKYGNKLRGSAGLALMIHTLDSLTFEDLVADNAVCQLKDALDRLKQPQSRPL